MRGTVGLRAWATLTLVLAAGLSGCARGAGRAGGAASPAGGGGGSPAAGPAASPTPVAGPVSPGGAGGVPVHGPATFSQGVWTLRLGVEPARVPQGGKVKIVLEVRNASGTVQSLTFPSGQSYDFWVTSEDGAEVWRWSREKYFTQEVRKVEVRAGQELRFEEVWEAEVAPGRYLVAGKCTAAELGQVLTAFLEVTG